MVIALLIFSDNQTLPSIQFAFEALVRISPYIIVSVGVAALLKASEADKLVSKAFSGSPMKAIAVASIFGTLSPFCSCGVIPLVVGLLAAGVPIAAVLAFCIASPIMDPEMFILTFAGLGLEFAVVKTIAAMSMGIMTGYITLLYLNGYSAIPLVRGLMDLGMSPATGLSFMIAGSVTSIPAAIAVWTLAKPRLFALYILMAILGSILSGLIYSMWL